MKKNKRITNYILFFTVAALISFADLFGCGLKGYALEASEEQRINDANLALSEIISQKEVMGSVFLCDYYDVCSEPDINALPVQRVFSGQLVNIDGLYVDEARNVWAHVSFIFRDEEFDGYILRENIAVSDELFLEWESEYSMTKADFEVKPLLKAKSKMFKSVASPLMSASLQGEEGEPAVYSPDVSEFPESYRDKLQKLKDEHPNWSFVKMYTGLDFQTVINNELTGKKSLVSKSFDECCKEGECDSTGWYYASEGILKYYMDPRNALDITHIFCFEQLTYNAEYHKEEAIRTYLKNTFMTDDNGATVPGMSVSYPSLIFALAKNDEIYVSPFLIASRILQEQGAGGGSSLISGVYPGYEGYYNYFNIGANGTNTTEIIVNGLEYARNHWADGMPPDYGQYGAYNSISYGARFLADSYIKNGQDTLYLQKYNVNPASAALYSHQYMQNISAPYSEGYSTKNMYEKSGALDNSFVFKIPVFDNMPQEPCEKPVDTTEVCLTLPASAGLNGVSSTPSVWIDGVERASVSRNGHLVVDTGNNTSTNAVVYKYDSAGVCSGMYVWMLDYAKGAYSATYEPMLEDLLVYEGFSIRITGISGIRCMTSINEGVRNTLISGNIDGYSMSESGTLIMLDKNLSTRPFVVNGEKTAKGLSYGVNTSGGIDNVIFETVDGRQRFTAVLVDIAAKNYKTKYAFKGYVTLNKGAKTTTIYGPTVSRSIYELAEKYINRNSYPVGSSQYNYLQKIISDADSLD